jgi:hypothetical protein
MLEEYKREYERSIGVTDIEKLRVEKILQVITKYLKLTSSYYGFSLRAQEQLVKKILIFISFLNPNSDIFAPEIIVIFNSAHLFDKNIFEIFRDNKDINYCLLPSKSSTNKLITVEIETKGGDLSTISKFHNRYFNSESKEKDPIDLWSNYINDLGSGKKDPRSYPLNPWDENWKLKKISAEVIEKYISLVLLLNTLDKTN